ncbi:MAG: heme ABC exporter ATP-binding protein CcmA [Pseudomonadota bacterium]
MQLIAENLACDRGDTRIFEGVSFALKSGEGMLVTGPNGAGKSSLLRVVAGFLPAAAGTVACDGNDIAQFSHYLGPQNGMKPALTVAENLEFWQNYFGIADFSIVAALERVGLSHVHHVPYSDLSTGQKRRIAIARLFLNHRPIWLLDEPTSGLDGHAEEVFAGIVSDHMKAGGIVVAATHLPIDVDGMKMLRFAERAL